MKNVKILIHFKICFDKKDDLCLVSLTALDSRDPQNIKNVFPILIYQGEEQDIKEKDYARSIRLDIKEIKENGISIDEKYYNIKFYGVFDLSSLYAISNKCLDGNICPYCACLCHERDQIKKFDKESLDNVFGLSIEEFVIIIKFSPENMYYNLK